MSYSPLLFSIGGYEWIIILFAVLLLFGAKKIPELAKGLGKGIREFKDATKDVKKEIDDEVKDLDKNTNN